MNHEKLRSGRMTFLPVEVGGAIIEGQEKRCSSSAWVSRTPEVGCHSQTTKGTTGIEVAPIRARRSSRQSRKGFG